MKIRKQINKHLAGDKNNKKVGCHMKYCYESRLLHPMKIFSGLEVNFILKHFVLKEKQVNLSWKII